MIKSQPAIKAGCPAAWWGKSPARLASGSVARRQIPMKNPKSSAQGGSASEGQIPNPKALSTGPGVGTRESKRLSIEIKERGGELLIRVKVQPKASADAIVGEHGGALKIRVAAAPEKGKANRAVVEFIAEKLGLKRSDVSIVSGEHSRDKLLAIRGVKREELLDIL